eukprot:TRINITY_DN8293_c0_g2_i1.p1 TRINITY_DN8293_c0_g2~~TRINITY_DN8293_c0_g2_i1.p1  ORF type:complete len:354 (-),score=7.99 TRINITY_DN8293_c0_g2_i1:27-1013(-)
MAMACNLHLFVGIMLGIVIGMVVRMATPWRYRVGLVREETSPLSSYIRPASTLSQLSSEAAQTPSLSLNQSDGYFDEPADVWMQRVERQQAAMNVQSQLLSTCVEGLYHDGEPTHDHAACLPACKKGSCQPSTFWQIHYEPTFSCLDTRRIGFPGDGGKWICDPQKISKQKTCLVYSIGSCGQYDFEKGMRDIHPECEIHTIDMAPSTGKEPSYTHYHSIKVGNGPGEKNVSTITRDLGHRDRVIDIFKIDCEYCEWETYKSWFGNGVYIRQLLIEVHGISHSGNVHSLFKHLFDLGYVVFNKEPNLLVHGNFVEFSFIKMTPEFALR